MQAFKYNPPCFLKWAGGKRQLLPEFAKIFPSKIERYFEPFLGAGSVFFFIKQNYAPKFCMISDINKDLIATFRAVQRHPHQLLKQLAWFRQKDSKNFYYTTRVAFNNRWFEDIKRCAAFIYLNKTCFNGLYRVNVKNEFNVPYANYKNPLKFDRYTILTASELLQGVTIKKQDYREIAKIVHKSDFVYLDPCYDPLTKTSFDMYTPNRFSESDRIELAKFIRTLKNKKAYVMLSNNDNVAIRQLYKDFTILSVQANRFINSKADGRGKVTELVITNY